jgi:hypothetical protein
MQQLRITYKHARTVTVFVSFQNTRYIYYSHVTEWIRLQCRKHNSAHNMSTQSTPEITRRSNDRWHHVSQDTPPTSLSLFAFRKHIKWKCHTVKINGAHSKEKVIIQMYIKCRIINLSENIKVINKCSIFAWLTEVCTRTAFLWDTTPCGLVDRYHLPEYGGGTVVRNGFYTWKLSSNKIKQNPFIRPKVVWCIWTDRRTGAAVLLDGAAQYVKASKTVWVYVNWIEPNLWTCALWWPSSPIRGIVYYCSTAGYINVDEMRAYLALWEWEAEEWADV